jgi:hypothetical protein
LVDPIEQTKKQTTHSGNDLNFLVLSEIVFDVKHQFALLKYLVVCGHHCDSGATLIMEKIDGHWAASSRRPCAMFVN